MCSATPCATCGKTTWRGCGQHIDAVMARIPTAQRCTCDRAAAPTSPPARGSWLRRRFS